MKKITTLLLVIVICFTLFGCGDSNTLPNETTTAESNNSYLVKVTADVLNIREKAGTDSKITGQIKDKGTYTIVAESNGKGATKWGKLKSGAGWISLDFVERITS